VAGTRAGGQVQCKAAAAVAAAGCGGSATHVAEAPFAGVYGSMVWYGGVLPDTEGYPFPQHTTSGVPPSDGAALASQMP
jgi:hypothetical protein